MDAFNTYDCGQLLQLISEGRLVWEYQRSGDVDYLRKFASENFYPMNNNQNISSNSIKHEHDKYKQATSKLLEICPQLFTILQDWCTENERYNSIITDEMKKDRDERYHNTLVKMQQQECAVMVFGDTGAGKSSLINMILEQELMRTSAIKTTFTVCEIRYSTTKKYSVAETETSPFSEQPYPSSSKQTITTSDRRQLDYVRERYECPIDLLEGGIVIADSPGLNENDVLTKLVQTYMADCLVFICVINRGITDSLQNMLNELKASGRKSAKSIFFVVTHLDEKDPHDQQQAMNQIHTELSTLYEDYDPIKNCCMINPDKACKILFKHHLYERTHYEFLQKFIPFLSNVLKLKLQYLFNELYDISERLFNTIHVKYNQSKMESQQCSEITNRIMLKIQKFAEAKGRILTKTRPLSNSFNKDIIEKMLTACKSPEFKNDIEQEAIRTKLPSLRASSHQIGNLKFAKKNEEWHVKLTDADAMKVFNKYAISLRTTATLFGKKKSNEAGTHATLYPVSAVELCKIYCQHNSSQWIQKQMESVLDKETKAVTHKIWEICQNDLQAIDDEIMDDYRQLTDENNGRHAYRSVQERHKTLLERMTDGGSILNFFTRTKLWFVTHTFEMPLHAEALLAWFNGITYKEMKENENSFKLKVTQHFRERITEKLEHRKRDLEKEFEEIAKEESSTNASASSSSRSGESSRIVPSNSIVDYVLNVFEQSYTEIQQLAQTEQTSADAKKWEETCTIFISKLEPIKYLFNNFRATQLLVWPLKSNQIIREINPMELTSYNDYTIYQGQLMIENSASIPVYIRQLKNDYNVLDIYSECETLTITNNYQHILHCYGIYTDDSNLFVVTEPIYLKLETFLSDTKGALLTTDERIQLALELAQCIQYLHREKVYCSCIHPNSIMMTADQHIKLSAVGEKEDFLYLSPERKLRRRNISPFYENIYAFGLVLYRLFHTDPKDIELFHSQKRLLPLIDPTNKTDVSKTYQNASAVNFQIPKINPNINNTIGKLILACCSINEQERPDINVIITILSLEKIHGNNRIPFPLQNNEIKYYGLLAIDGGGSRGIIAAKILEILESKLGNPLWTAFDLVGGSSTGGLLLLSLIQRRTRADELAELYKTLSSKIFPFCRLLPTTQYPHEPLEEELRQHFEELRLTTTEQSPKLFVVTKKSTDTQPYLLRNYDVIPTDDNLFYPGCSGWLCCEAARATTAAPTYFAPFVKDGLEYIDGGVGFNNPVQLVFEETLSLSTVNTRQIEQNQTLYHFPIAYIVSIGTGAMPSLNHEPLSRTPVLSSLNRVKNATELLIEQATDCENTHLTMKNTCQRYNIPYFRFNPTLYERIRMDLGDETNLTKMIDLTNEYMNTEMVQAEMERLCKLISDKQD